MKLTWHSEARMELREALAYYRDQAGLDVARRLAQDAKAAAQQVLAYPELGARISHGTRRFVLNDFPYTLIYRVVTGTGTVVILAVAHHSRRPGYWVGRR